MMDNQSKRLSPSSSLESELALDTSSLSPSPNNEIEESADSSTSSSSSGIFSKRDSACSTSSIPEVDEEEEEENEETEKMVVKEKSAIITTAKVGNEIISGIPESILNEAKYQIKEDSSELDNRNNAVMAIVSLENNVSNNRLNHHHHQKNNKDSEANGNDEDDDEDQHDLEYNHEQNGHHHHHHHHSTDNALELNNQLNMLERILFPETHHKIITPRITITIDPSMVFDECEEEADSDDGDDEGVGHHIVVVAEEYDDGDDYSSVFLDELSSETGMSDKTLADLDVVDEEADDGVVNDLDEDIGVLDDVNGSSGSDGGSTSSKDENGNAPGTITIDDSGIIITCEKYGKVPIEIINDHLTGRSQSQQCTDVRKDDTSNNSNANDETTGKAVIEKQEQHDHKEAGTGEAGGEKSNINSVACTTITETSEQQQETDHQSDVNVLSTSPQNHKLGRASSSPSNTNLSEPSSEPGESRSLKTEEVKPRRRNTIADIFRWYFFNAFETYFHYTTFSTQH